MAESTGGNSGRSVNIVAIVAILALIAVAIWVIAGRRQAVDKPQTGTNPTTGESDADVNIKVDIPDSVVIETK